MTKVIESSVTVSKIKRIRIFPQAICQESENLGEDAVDNAFFAALHLILGNVQRPQRTRDLCTGLRKGEDGIDCESAKLEPRGC